MKDEGELFSFKQKILFDANGELRRSRTASRFSYYLYLKEQQCKHVFAEAITKDPEVRNEVKAEGGLFSFKQKILFDANGELRRSRTASRLSLRL